MQETHLSLQEQLDQLAALHEEMQESPKEVEPYQKHPLKKTLPGAPIEGTEIQWINRR